MKLQSGHEAIPLEEDEMKKRREDFGGFKDGLVRLDPGRWLLPSGYTHFAEKIRNFKLKSSDVVVLTYPKCGTTWTQEILWTMMNNPELNHPQANLPISARSPLIYADIFLPIPPKGSPPPKDPIIEHMMKMCPGTELADGIFLSLTEKHPDPRIIKTHLPISLMPPTMLDTSKVVYVARNPKDTIISYHHQCKILKVQDYRGSFEDFVQYFVDDDLVYGPYWLHIKEAWEKRDHPNLHFIFYEDLKANPLEELRKLNNFLNTNLTEEQLVNIVKYTSFSEMKARDKSSKEDVPPEVFNEENLKKEGGFFRKGEAGDWKGKLAPHLDAKVDQWIEKNISNLGISFK